MTVTTLIHWRSIGGALAEALIADPVPVPPSIHPPRPYALQWPLLEEACDLLTSAPDDEIMAEMLLVQGELAQQVWCARLVCVEKV